MLDLSRELKMVEGMPRWKWERFKACVDAMYERAEKEHALRIDMDVLKERSISRDEFQLET